MLIVYHLIVLKVFTTLLVDSELASLASTGFDKLHRGMTIVNDRNIVKSDPGIRPFRRRLRWTIADIREYTQRSQTWIKKLATVWAVCHPALSEAAVLFMS